MVGFSPVMALLNDAYGVSAFTTTLLVLPFHLFYVPLNFPANFLIDRYGLQLPTVLGSICFIVGAWARLFVSDDADGFYIIIIGQCIMAVGQAFLISAPPKIANIWFGDKERTIATTNGSLSTPVGSLLGFILPILFMHEPKDKDDPE